MAGPKPRLVLTRLARDDIRNIQAFTIQRWGVEQATAYEKAIDQALERLQVAPRLGRPRDDLRSDLRGYVVEQHVIFYRIEGTDVVVQRVLHSRQDIVDEMGW